MKELMGHIASNPNKIKVLEVLKSRKEAEVKVISKFTRIPERILYVIMGELRNDGVVEEADGKFHLTDTGYELLKNIKGF